MRLSLVTENTEHPLTSEHDTALSRMLDAEKLAAALVTGSATIIIVKGYDGRYLLANPQTERLLGISASTLLGKRDNDFPLSESLREAISRHDEKVLKDGGTFVYRSTLFLTDRPEAQPVTYRILKHPYRTSPDAEISGIVMIARDVSDELRLEEEREDVLERLRRSEQHLQLHIQQTPLGVIEWDLDFRITAWNPAAERIFGYSENEAIGHSGLELLLPSAIRPLIGQLWDTLLSQKGGNRSQNDNLTKDQRLITCEWYNTPLVNEEGRVVGVASLVHDITEQKAAIAALEASEGRFRSVVESLAEGILITDLDDVILYANSRTVEITGHTVEEMLGQLAYKLLLPEEMWAPLEKRNKARQAGIAESYETRMWRKDGTLFWAQISAAPFRTLSGEVIGTVGAITEITERKIVEQAREEALAALKASETRFRLLTENGSDILTILDAQAAIRYQSPSVKRLLGYTVDEMIGLNALHLVHPDDLLTVQVEMAMRRSPGVPSEPILYRFRHKDGTWRWLESIGTNLLHTPDIRGILVNTRDITERRLAEERMRWQAHHDALTGLPNRTYFLNRLEQALATARWRGEALAVLFLDLDRFKHINDTLGHERGDQLLQHVARRLSKALPKEAVIARMGGDEFTVLLPNIARPHDAVNFANHLLETLRPPIKLSGHEFYVGGSIGVSLFPEDGQDADTLLKNADVAMYRAKEQGGGHNQLYAATMSAAVFEHMVLEASLRRAIDLEEFTLHYQPQIDTASGQLTGLEALIRWQHSELGLVGPDTFIQLAENTGLISRLGEWVLRAVCHQASLWWHQGLLTVPVSVNVSARQFRTPEFADDIADILSEANLPPYLLNLELTESVLMEEGETTVNSLRRLKRLGVLISLDDFGTGYSSLAYLRRFPLDLLKIDRAFVRGLANEEADRAVVRALIELAHALGLSVLAEGVENADQYDHLRTLGCNAVQGYYLSRPLSTARITALLQSTPIFPLPAA